MRLGLVVIALVLLAPATASAQNSCVCTNVSNCGGSCGSATACCSFYCADTRTDIYNCGNCGMHCGVMETCQAGVCVCSVGSRSCYTGPSGTLGKGICKAGTQTCTVGAGGPTWGPCIGEVLPQPEICNGIDDNCDGYIDNIPGTSLPLVQSCYTGPPGTADKGICHPGNQTCVNGMWTACAGEQTPLPPACDVDNQCTGMVVSCDGGVPDLAAPSDLAGVDMTSTCTNGQTRSCYDGPPGTAGVGPCHAGMQTCSNNQWGPCQGEVTPLAEYCGSGDVDCDGVPDNDPLCPTGLSCIGGFCVDPNCTPCIDPGCAPTCDPGYACINNKCAPQPCPTTPCPTGQRCVNGKTCFDPCAAVTCAPGNVCYQGACVANDCTTFGCPPGDSCVNKICIGGIVDGGDGSHDLSVVSDASAPDGSAGDASAALDGGGPKPTGKDGCGCRVGGAPSSAPIDAMLFLGALLCLVWIARRSGE